MVRLHSHNAFNNKNIFTLTAIRRNKAPGSQFEVALIVDNAKKTPQHYANKQRTAMKLTVITADIFLIWKLFWGRSEIFSFSTVIIEPILYVAQ